MHREAKGFDRVDPAGGPNWAQPQTGSDRIAFPFAASLRADGSSGTCYAAAIFTSAFLLFGAQPMMGKFILPRFGGGPMIWTACLLFFQFALLLGYAYAWVSGQFFSIRLQCRVHLSLLAVALLTLPVTPQYGAWSADSTSFTTLAHVLTRSIGLPILALSSTFPLLLRWLNLRPRSGLALHPYALSNLASLSALLLYPVLIEPFITRTAQAMGWSAGFVICSLLCAWCAFRTDRENPEIERRVGVPSPKWTRLPGSHLSLWLGLAGCPTLLLSATTNQLSQDLAPIPFLWILPLSVYLLSYIVAFQGKCYHRRTGLPALGIALLSGCGLLVAGSLLSLRLQIGAWLVVLFVCCWVCHSELWRSRPTHGDQGLFYLMIASGGVLGSTLVAVCAPTLLRVVLELHLGLWLCSLVCLAALFTNKSESFSPKMNSRRWVYLGLAWLGLGFLLYQEIDFRYAGSIYRTRSFFGSLAVYETNDRDRHVHLRSLCHNATTHGIQNCAPEQRRVPLAYYSERSGLGAAISLLSQDRPRHLGVVGLGIGTIAAYAKAADIVTFYEIDPKVAQIAALHFSYLRDCPATVQIVYGDARLSLEHQPPQQFDLLVLDAFSSDAIPVHLLTREAFALYRRHLRPGGILAAHLSSVYLDLARPAAWLARTSGLKPLVLDHHPPASSQEFGLAPSVWMLASASWPTDLPRWPEIELRSIPDDSHAPWTDERVNLFDALR